MPVYNFQPPVGLHGQPADLLALHGLLLAVEIAPPEALATVLGASGAPIPPAHPGAALVDTGASCCCVEESVLVGLGLKPIGQLNVSSPNGLRLQNRYFARLLFPGSPIPPLEISVVGVQLNQANMVCLLGRDLLRHCVLIYNGPMGSYTISF